MPKLRQMPNEIFRCQRSQKSAKITKFGIRDANLATLAWTKTCFPSIAPKAFGKFHFISKSLATCFHSSSEFGGFM